MAGTHEAEVWGYVNGVITGTITAGEDCILACKRFRDDWYSGRWDCRTECADFVIDKIEAHLVHRQGEDLVGKPLKGLPMLLEPWEKFVIYGCLVFYVRGSEIRRVQEAFVYIPRKNGKTILISGMAWGLALWSAQSGAVIYIAAASLRQAMQSFRNIEHALTTHIYASRAEACSEEEGWRILDNNQAHVIENRDIGGGSVYIEALASNPDKQDSLNANIILVDELEDLDNSLQYNVLRDAAKAYANKLIFGISTAGHKGKNCFAAQRLKYCQKILRTKAQDEAADRIFIYICKADEDGDGNVDYLNPIQHKKANPNYGVSIRPSEMTASAIEAQNDPQQRREFLEKSLNIFVSDSRAYFRTEQFEESDRAYTWTLDELAKLPIRWYGGADLSKLYDLTAACLYGNYNGVDIVIPHCWFPLTQADRKAQEDNIPLFGWADDGWLTMCNSDTINVADVVEWFKGMKARGFRIRQIGQDRRFAREFFLAMKKAGFRIVDQPQYVYVKSEGFKRIEAAAINKKLYYVHAEPFIYCVGNVHAIAKTDDMMMYDKFDDHLRIDVFDAAVFAACRMLEDMEKIEKEKEWVEDA